MAREARTQRKGLHRVVLEAYPEGVYVYVFERPDSQFPEWDYLQDDWTQATGFCERKLGIPQDAWQEVPDTGLHGPHR